MKEATDLVVLQARDKRIACRVRRPGYDKKYKYEFTIRYLRENGAETEYSKIINGFGNWLFYGHSNQTHSLGDWYLIDLDVFREARNGNDAHLVPTTKNNYDGTHFLAFDCRWYPDLLIDYSVDGLRYPQHRPKRWPSADTRNPGGGWVWL